MNRRGVVHHLTVAAGLAVPRWLRAQATGKVWRIAFLHTGAAPPEASDSSKVMSSPAAGAGSPALGAGVPPPAFFFLAYALVPRASRIATERNVIRRMLRIIPGSFHLARVSRRAESTRGARLLADYSQVPCRSQV